jgi:hypothetical protein
VNAIHAAAAWHMTPYAMQQPPDKSAKSSKAPLTIMGAGKPVHDAQGPIDQFLHFNGKEK